MEESANARNVVRFGVFEMDLEAGQLRKNGRRVPLQEQPFRVLALLLKKPGRVVTREELQEKVWPDTHVDFDHSLNTAINKIREAIGDSAANPRFVETLPGRGYKFLAPVAGAGPTAHTDPVESPPPKAGPGTDHPQSARGSDQPSVDGRCGGNRSGTRRPVFPVPRIRFPGAVSSRAPVCFYSPSGARDHEWNDFRRHFP